MREACRVEISGVVQGVGFRPFVYRLAHRHGITGWVKNDSAGVLIHAEGPAPQLRAFRNGLSSPPPAARIATSRIVAADVAGHSSFEIRASDDSASPTARISPDLAICEACTAELKDSSDRRFGYPYINCTNCGPRYSIVLGLPYDRPQTTMRDWPLCSVCCSEYHDPADRRFHAQPVACPTCGPGVALEVDTERVATGTEAIARIAEMLTAGAILGIKGLGGYHLACRADDADAVARLRKGKHRPDKPFALMVRDLETAASVVDLSSDAESMLRSVARPVVIAPARLDLVGVAPGNRDLGIMLPYAPIHHLIFDAGAPLVWVMTSGNRAGEPIAFEDDDARCQLAGIADALLVGERPIARRIDDSVIRAGTDRSVVVRQARGLAPSTVAGWAHDEPILAVGADLKNTVTLVVEGEAIISQHVGNLSHAATRQAHRDTIANLLDLYAVDPKHLTVVYDLHPEYASTRQALEMPASRRLAVQHHHAHLASVVAEHKGADQFVVGLVLDGNGLGDDGTVWGGELFAGKLTSGFDRVGHLRPAILPGGDAAARWPVQAAAGFLHGIGDLPDLTAPPFDFPDRYRLASKLVDSGVRAFPTTSAGRLFDTVAALLGWTGPISFEGQAAIWLEQLARRSPSTLAVDLPFRDHQLDHRPLLAATAHARRAGDDPADIARAFHLGFAKALSHAAHQICRNHGAETVALTGGVFQNVLLLDEVVAHLEERSIRVWTHLQIPPNDGGISLGQAAIAATRADRAADCH